MEYHEQLIRQLEDYILAQKGLLPAGRLEFEHLGQRRLGYPYIRSLNPPLAAAFEACVALRGRPRSQVRFLEVGCGIGTKTAIARLAGLPSTGIDLRPGYIELARELYPDCRFECANALDFNYADFDLVYYHLPLIGDDAMYELERRILTQLPCGGMLVCTALTALLVERIYNGDALRTAWADKLLDPQFALGRLRVLQKLRTLSLQDFELS